MEAGGARPYLALGRVGGVRNKERCDDYLKILTLIYLIIIYRSIQTSGW